jgi:hypothetical protein
MNKMTWIALVAALLAPNLAAATTAFATGSFGHRFEQPDPCRTGCGTGRYYYPPEPTFRRSYPPQPTMRRYFPPQPTVQRY